MRNTWIIDFRHYLTSTGAMAELLLARAFAEYFASIVLHATSNLDDRLRCAAVGAIRGGRAVPGS